MKTLHICLLSEHLLANLIPVLQERPDAVLALATPSMQKLGLSERFKRLCVEHGIDCRIEPFEQAGWSAQLRSASSVNEIVEKDYAQWRVRLNLTGGTKTMALSLVLGLRGVPYEPFYCDTEHDAIETLQLNKSVISTPLHDVLTVNAYLSARGLQVSSTGADDTEYGSKVAARSTLTQELANLLPRTVEALHFINDVGASVETNGGTGLKQTRELSAARSAQEVLELFVKNQLVTWHPGDPACIEFADKAAAKYVAGGWLEEYVGLVLANCAPHAHTIDVKVLHERGGGVPNQFHGLALHRNRMLFIETKTANLYKKEKEQEVVNKIEALGRFATGKFGALLLVSARPLPKHLLNRARAFDIDVLYGTRITRLKEYIQAWMNGKKLAGFSA